MVEKITFSNLKKEVPLRIKMIKINDKEVEIKQYLPVNEKLNLITSILEQVAQNEYSFVNPVQLDVFSSLGIVYAYTNIEFTEEEKANPATLYDELENQGIINAVVGAIPITEYDFIVSGIEKTVSEYYTSRNSLRGIFEDITTDYSNLNLDATEIQKKLADPDNLTLLKDVMQKMG